MGVDEIRKTWRQTEERDRAEGRIAYACYQEIMFRLGAHYGYTLEQATAVFCALSPSAEYFGNLRSAATLMLAHGSGVPVERCTVTTFNHNKALAWRVLNGESFLQIARGPKIRAFYTNIVDLNDAKAITVDGHMVGVWAGRQMTMREALFYIKGVGYKTIAADVRAVAESEGIDIPARLQSTLWTAWKRIHNVAYNPRFSFLRPYWRAIVDPRNVKPYPFRPERTLEQMRFDLFAEAQARGAAADPDFDYYAELRAEELDDDLPF